MTREELMTHARAEVDKAFEGKRNRMMNLVEQAWAEGKRNAETDALAEATEAALDKLFTRQLPKHGRWESYMIDKRGYSNVFRCTSCSQITQTYMYMKECEYDFCPHCGAKMDGGEPISIWDLAEARLAGKTKRKYEEMPDNGPQK